MTNVSTVPYGKVCRRHKIVRKMTFDTIGNIFRSKGVATPFNPPMIRLGIDHVYGLLSQQHFLISPPYLPITIATHSALMMKDSDIDEIVLHLKGIFLFNM